MNSTHNQHQVSECVRSDCDEANLNEGNAWVLATKRVGDPIAGWVVGQLNRDNVRQLGASERCELTAFCYPSGAKVVRARLERATA